MVDFNIIIEKTITDLNQLEKKLFSNGFSKGFMEGADLSQGSLEKQKDVYIAISVRFLEVQMKEKDFNGLGYSYGFYIGLIENVLKYNNAYHFLLSDSNTERFILATQFIKNNILNIDLSYAKAEIDSIDVNKFVFLKSAIDSQGWQKKKQIMLNSLVEIKKAFN